MSLRIGIGTILLSINFSICLAIRETFIFPELAKANDYHLLPQLVIYMETLACLSLNCTLSKLSSWHLGA